MTVPTTTPAPPATEPPPAPAATEPNPTPGDPAVGDEPLGAPGLKALEAERAARAAAEKAQKDLQARLDDIEKANLTDLEKAQREAQENKDAAARATTEALRWRAAAKHGISDEDAETFLTGADEATITRQAETYAKRIAEAKGETAPAPRPDLSQSAVRTPGSAADAGEADFVKFMSDQLGG